MDTALLRLTEVADQLRVSRATVYRLIASGDLAAVHVGKRRLTRVERSALDAYIERLRRERAA
jgi:excisionase family DNA binding protein